MSKHLLSACLFLKTYSNETVLSAMTGADEKTKRFYLWMLVKALARLTIVCLFLFVLSDTNLR